MNEERLSLFKTRLAETIAWCAICANVADPRTSLRTASLHPENMVLNEHGNFGYHWCTAEETDKALSTLAQQRAKLLRQAGVSPACLPDALNGGAFLVWEPDASLWDGLSEDASHGFFDMADVPAWDTWVCSFLVPHSKHLCLLSWVPPAFIRLADEGISVNCVACISWASHQTTNYPFLKEVQQTGLLV